MLDEARNFQGKEVVKEITQSSYKTSNDLVTDFVKLGILKEMIGQSRNSVFVFDQYLKLFKY